MKKGEVNTPKAPGPATNRHYPVPLPAMTKQKPRRTCKVCIDKIKAQPDYDKQSSKRGETHYWYSQCQVPLCIDKPFHRLSRKTEL